MINTTHKNSCFNNQLKVNIPISSVVDQQTINPHNLFYQCSKYSPDFLFSKSRIRDYRNEPHFPTKIKLLSSQIQINTLFKNNYEIKERYVI